MIVPLIVIGGEMTLTAVLRPEAAKGEASEGVELFLGGMAILSRVSCLRTRCEVAEWEIGVSGKSKACWLG